MTLPEEIATRAATVLEERSPESAQLLKSAPIDVQQSALRVFAGSDFVVDSIVRDAQLLPQLLARASSQLGGALPLLHRSAVSGGDENQFMSALRLWRRAELTRIAWRDLAGWSPLSETLWALSQAADKAIAAAQQHAWATLVSRHGPPDLPPGEAQQLIIIAMGKLGGWELNFSSDVDLVFLFDGHGETTGALPITHEEFFLKLGQRVIRYLDALTAEGRAYRVDMRLRPFGASGPLVASVAAFEDYLERQGRDWERYAWIKARAVTGGTSYAEVFRSSVQPFVYRRYLDFGVFEALREMKNLIEREVERRDLRDNIKLGPGGIREIEFIVQALQLIRGGSDRRLQNSSLLETLPRLAGARMLPAEATSELAAAYEFLRRLENRLQMLQDQQTHSLPADPLARSRVAFAMNFGSWEELSGALQGHRQQVAAHFAALVKTEGRSPSPKTSLNALFDREDFRAALATHLCAMGMLDAADAPPVAQLFQDLQNSPLVRRMDPAGRRRLGALLELMVDEVVPRPGSLATLRRLLRVVEAIGTRSAYFALLSENPLARRRLTDLASHGDFLTAQIAAFPVLLDELIDERLFDELPTRAQLAADLVERLSDVADGDEQLQVERLRH